MFLDCSKNDNNNKKRDPLTQRLNRAISYAVFISLSTVYTFKTVIYSNMH